MFTVAGGILVAVAVLALVSLLGVFFLGWVFKDRPVKVQPSKEQRRARNTRELKIFGYITGALAAFILMPMAVVAIFEHFSHH